MFTSFVGADSATADVEAGGAVVGTSAIITTPHPGIAWTNGTSVFLLTGPALELASFQEQFGL